MAEITMGKARLNKHLATLPGTQGWLDDYIFEAGVRAEQELIEHKADDHSFIDVERGRVDRYLVLNDERGQKAALSIEYGRSAYGIDADGNTVSPTSHEAIRSVGAMEGLYILHKAMRMPIKRKGKVTR